MATATLIDDDPNAPRVLLEMSMAEARTLRCISGSITGSCDDSPRKYTDRIWSALGFVNVRNLSYTGFAQYGVINFGDPSESFMDELDALDL